MYHYVRDSQRTDFPRLHALSAGSFREQVGTLSSRYEMATLESALAFLKGEYAPSRDLCLLTFDDGLKEHYAEVLPVLAEMRIQGLFFIITGCVEARVAAVHKNHFLMAALDFPTYQSEVLTRLESMAPDVPTDVEPGVVRQTYRWDTPEAGRLKYLLNFSLSEDVRNQLLDDMFARHCGDEIAFARQLYVSWDEAREMQAHGMLMGGHSHTHVPLATQQKARREAELRTCARELRRHLNDQVLWPFAYPYGKADTFSTETTEELRDLDFDSAFVTVVGNNHPGQDTFQIRRIDTKDAV